jgi:hypothetical protein
VVYGYPAQSKLSITRGGIPAFQTVDEDEFRKINLELTWCAPVKAAPDPKAAVKKPGKGQETGSRNGWSAACVPHSTLGNHTIINNVQPAFAVSSLSYNAETSSNEGTPPIVRDDTASFAAPLRVEYVYAGRQADGLTVREDIYLGDELTSSRPEYIYASNGKAVIDLAGTAVELDLSKADTVIAKPAGQPLAGQNPKIERNQLAALMSMIARMRAQRPTPAKPELAKPELAKPELAKPDPAGPPK